jgi:hypothetical protein
MDKARDYSGMLNCSGRCMETYRPYQTEVLARPATPATSAPQPQPARPNRLLTLFRQLTKQHDSLKEQSAWSNGNT